MDNLIIAKELMSFIDNSPTPYHTVENCIDILKNNNFQELDIKKSWNLSEGNSYFVSPYNTSLFAFTIGNNLNENHTIRLSASHTDTPCFRIKPKAEIIETNYLKLNIETYGGAIFNTWLDRPLSVAGKIILKSNNVFEPEVCTINIDKPFITIPNLAIHMNSEINKGIELNQQEDLLPICAMLNESLNKENYFMKFIADYINRDVNDILDFDLFIYNTEKGCILGMNNDFLQSPRLDNITSVVASLNAIINSKRNNGINIIACFDNEEIGSHTKQGADSNLLMFILEKIYAGLSKTSIECKEAVMRSIALSVDVAHTLHPNKPKVNDPILKAELNKGVVIKFDSKQKYSFDAKAIGSIIQLCNKHDIKYQKFANRSDSKSGSTLGSLLSSWVPMKVVDVGVGLLAMHSARETMGTYDQAELQNLITHFFNEE